MCRTPDRTVIVALLFIVTVCEPNHPASAQPRTEKLEDERNRELDALIDSLANRVNKPPKILAEKRTVIFHEKYDFDEQSRARDVLDELSARDGNELWPRLVAHFEDGRYAFTYKSEQGPIYNATVGQLCQAVALGDLALAYTKHSPLKPYPSMNFTFHPRPLVKGPDFGVKNKLFPAWYEKRRKKNLCELQIEILESTIAEGSPALEPLSEQQRKQYVPKAETQIERLRKTGEPVVDRKRFDGELYLLISAADIEYYRDKFENARDPNRPRRAVGPPPGRTGPPPKKE